ncbi:MAG: hypothetical protein RJA87_1263 [Pseudomonadota bacterium]|jgi:hypothetical protein
MGEGSLMLISLKKTESFAARLLIGAFLVGLAQGAPNNAEAAENQSIPEQIKHLIELKRAAEGYELGLLHPELIGDTLFDYYFGIAAVDAGRAWMGVLALERFMLKDPSNLLARLELGRGYVVIGDYVRAEREFNYVLDKNPPKSVVRTIDQFIAQIRLKRDKVETTYGAFFEGGVGYNSNVNSGVAGADIKLPFFGDVKLSNDALQKSSLLSEASGGAFVNVPIKGQFKALASLTGNYRNHAQIKGFDQGSIVGNISIGQMSKDLTLTVGPTYGLTYLDGLKFRETLGANLSFRKTLSPLTKLTSDLSFQQLTYSGINENRSGNLYSASIGLDRILNLPMKPVVSVIGYYAQEQNDRGRDDFSRKIVGSNVSVAFVPAPFWAFSVGGGLSRWDYNAADPLFLNRRNDWFKSAEVKLQYELEKGLTLRLEAQASQDDANLPLYQFQQNQVKIALRKEW